MSSLVNNPAVLAAELLVPRPLFARPYTAPFVLVWAFFLQIYLNHYDAYVRGSEWTFVYVLGLSSLNALVWLMPYWNIDVAALFNYSKVSSISHAQFIKITPAQNTGVGEICPIRSQRFANGDSQTFFYYQKRRHLLHEASQVFAPPSFTVDESPKLAVLQQSTGLHGDLSAIARNYGENKFDIPIPTFLELFKEHAVAPFFVFQLFCVALWLMDEQKWYSMFSLFMLVTFEMTTVFQRRTTMTEFQSMGIRPYQIYAYRNNAWSQISTTALLPGDLVSITRTTQDSALPCDLVLVDGSAIVNEAMLSGESTPLLKESIKLRPPHAELDLKGMDQLSVLHGGTLALQVTPPQDPVVPQAPDSGALAIVGKTGFETSQGSLVRMMVFSSEKISVGSKELLYFILFLLVFAIIALRYVWIEGTKMGRIQSKLIFDCVIIITSVVPPELPMQLTMAVNSSLASLLKYYVYCTEPFRIPLAGRVDVCCFDKTGTLTAEDLVFEGLAGFDPADVSRLVPCHQAPPTTSYVLGSAHALVKLDSDEVVGDPMEQATIKAGNWLISNRDVVQKVDSEGNPTSESIRIMRRFQFSSSLKRLLVISRVSAVPNKNFVAAKGAPETIKAMLVDAPANYQEVYKSFTRAGLRVLALAYKYIDPSVNIAKCLREDIESDLHFAGFIVFHCPLKDDALETIEMLNESSHRCVMITGDNPLTACHVAQQVKITSKEVLILDAPESHHQVAEENLVWRNVTESVVIPFSSANNIDVALFSKYDVCVTGYALNYLSEHNQILDLIKHTWVYARVSPRQKEFVLTSLKGAGYITLMCGDGTNDVGALKQAHIGVALLNGTEDGLKKIAQNRSIEVQKNIYEKQVALLTNWNKQPPPVPAAIAHLYPPGPLNPHFLKAMNDKGIQVTDDIKKAVAAANSGDQRQLAQNATERGGYTDTLLGALNEAELMDEAPVLKLGDASVAAPFTSKLANVLAVTNIVRQGRSALVSTIQMYKILALNCLILAYSLSVLYLAGMKFGDAQLTVLGVLLSICFLSISRGKPMNKLSRERPHDGIFSKYIMGSILGQFAVHMAILVYITNAVWTLEPREPTPDLEKKFAPSLLNTAMFLLLLAQEVLTFWVNYQGLPFKESIYDNKGMLYGLLGVVLLALAGSTELIPELNEAMTFVKMTAAFKTKLTLSIIGDIALSMMVELGFKHFFMNAGPADIAVRD